MTSLLRHRLRRLRRHVLYALAVLLVGVALLVGGFSQLLPMVQAHPDKVAAWLSERAGQPVAFDHLATRWTRRGPLLQLDGLRIGQGEGVRIGQAEVLVALYSGLFPGAPLTELRLRGLALTLQRDDAGRWSVRGLPSSGGGGDPLETLRRLGELQVIGGRLHIDAPSLELATEIPRIDLRLRVDGQRLRAGAKGWIDTGAPPVTAVLDFDRQQGDGQAWLAAAPAELSAWSPLLHIAGVNLRQGRGTAQGWLQMRDTRVVSVTVDADLEELQLAGTPFAAAGAAPTTMLDKVQLRARWEQAAGGWRLDAPRLRIASEGRQRSLDGLLLAGGRDFALHGRQIDVTPLLRLAALSDQLEPGVRQWLDGARPMLRFSDVSISGRAGGTLQGHGELEEAAFSASGGRPGVSGLRGHFEGDGQALALTLRPDHRVDFNWPSGFGVLHELQLDGQLVGWREGDGWQVGTPALRVQGTDYAANVRGGLRFQGDGTRPWISLAAELDDVPMTAAKRFWVRSKMSEAAVAWLDAALVDGHVRNGIGLAVGDLDDWPFDGHNGRFEARGHIDDGTIRFDDDWPLMDAVDADIAFIANGFELHGHGGLAGVKVDHFEAGIADFVESRLQVAARTATDSRALLAMLRKSPLQARYGETLDNLVVSGPAAVTFDLQQPLRAGQPGQLAGEVELQGASLADRRWDLKFDNVRGKAVYGGNGFDAPALAVRHKERDGVLTLRAGEPVRDPANAFEAELTAALGAGDLLDRAPELDWLRPYIDGVSRWTIGVALPLMPAGGRIEPPTRLSLRSDLRGTRLRFPAPLDKPAHEALTTTVSTALPLGSGLTEVAFGRRLALAARTANDSTGVQVTLGSDVVDRAPPADGLVVNGRTTTLDALEWIGLARGGGDDAGSGAALALKEIDVLADRLLLVGGHFDQTRLRLRPETDAIAVQLDGPSLAGDLRVPNAQGAAVSGQLARVFWQSAAPADAADERDSPEPAVNPANIPPLALDIGELRFGRTMLGHTVLRTRPLADGLKVEQLRFRAPRQAIDVEGEWRGVGDQAHTHAAVQVDSGNLGGLMDNLGYGGQLRAGQGQVRLDARWPGTPQGFQLAGLEGSLAVNARNGQLLEVEPGAGRVLGLLSVAQLPRRLMLDFRDFYSKGLAFNQIEGQVHFGDGLARTERIAMEGPAADITIRGQADLRTQQFDQTIDVNPRSGNLLTVVGAVAGGPIGAAVGAAANAVLGKPLGEIGAKTYKVTGPWKDPTVDVVGREPARLPPPVIEPLPAGSP